MRAAGQVSPAMATPSAGQRRSIEVRSPADGRVLGSVPIHDASDVANAVARAKEAQEGWGSLTPVDRVRRLDGLIEAVTDAADGIADLVVSETGKPRVEALIEVTIALDLMRFFRKVVPEVFGGRAAPMGWLLSKAAGTFREPLGVIGIVSPWNYPFSLPMDAVSTALYAGNAAVLKPSEATPLTGVMIGDLARTAGLPEGLVGVVTGDGSTGAALVGAGVDKLAFTGSPGTGRKVMAAAAEHLTPVTLELGGKDPAIVLEDADLDRAARGIAYGGFFNAGQTCVATERVYVTEAVFEPFLERLTSAVSALRPGHSGDRDTGPMTTEGQLGVVESQLEDALVKGARVAVGGGRLDPASNVFQPTVLVDVDESMDVMRDETFGPLLPVARVSDQEEAIRRCNASPFGFFASVWTGDRSRGEAVAARLRCGGVSINDTLSHWAVPALPIGGVGLSGFGRTRGEEGLREMSRARVLFRDRLGLGRELWWFPYGPRTERLIRALVEYRGRGGPRGLAAAVRHYFGRGA